MSYSIKEHNIEKLKTYYTKLYDKKNVKNGDINKHENKKHIRRSS